MHSSAQNICNVKVWDVSTIVFKNKNWLRIEIKPLDSGRRQKSRKICSWSGSKSRVEKFLQSSGREGDCKAWRMTLRFYEGVFEIWTAGIKWWNITPKHILHNQTVCSSEINELHLAWIFESKLNDYFVNNMYAATAGIRQKMKISAHKTKKKHLCIF